MKRTLQVYLITILCLILPPLLPGCADEALRPDGWTEPSHGKGADPNDSVLFAQDTVKRLDVVITPARWQSMLDDMKTKYGAFGSTASGGGGKDGGPPGGAPLPPPMTDACKGKKQGDTCQAALGGQSLSGTCRGSASLACVPDAWISACKSKKAGDACSVSMGGPPAAGTCTTAGTTLFCRPPPPGDGGPGPGPAVDSGPKNQGPDGGFKDNPKPIYVPCTLSLEGKTWRHVGIRFKGYSSLRNTWRGGSYKLPLRIDTDQFEDDHPEIKDQRVWGFKELSLANNCFDPSLIREKVTPDLFRQAGVPAPRTAFYRVYVDHGKGPLYFGLYTMIEVPDRPLFNAQFIKKKGNLYKPEGRGATWSQFGSQFDKDAFPKKTNKDSDYSDIKAAVTALHASQSDRAGWRAGLKKSFDADGFVRWLAVNTVLVNWDTYGNSPQNYYLYADPGNGGRLHWIPWDNNMALSTTGGKFKPLPLDMASVNSKQWPLIGKLMADPIYRAAYVLEVSKFIGKAFATAAAQSRVKSAHALIKPYVVGKDGERPGYSDLTAGKESAEFREALTDLLQHVTARNKAARQFLKSASPPAGDAGPPDADGATPDSGPPGDGGATADMAGGSKS